MNYDFEPRPTALIQNEYAIDWDRKTTPLNHRRKLKLVCGDEIEIFFSEGKFDESFTIFSFRDGIDQAGYRE